MSYLVLARKWRPQKFADVVGQSHVVHTLQSAINKDRLAHSFLFTGARGVGKTTAARLLAKALECEQGPTAEPCGECQLCKEVADSRCVDVLEIDGASNRGIDQVRELREGVRYMPQAGRYKIIIIDEVHMLTTEAFNALLKTLEEPPAHVKFIFATTEPHRIPVTILSRCQRFDFKRIAQGAIVDHLRTIIDAEQIEAEEEALHQVARAAGGSMRDALSLLDQAIAYADSTITAALASEALGIIDRRVVVQIVEGVLARDAAASLSGVAQAYHAGYDLRQLLAEFVEELRHLVVARAVQDPKPLMDLPDGEVELVVKRAQQASAEDLQRLFGMALEQSDILARADSPRLVLDVLVARMAAMPPYRSLEELSDLLAQLNGTEAPRNLRPSAPARPRQSATPSPATRPVSRSSETKQQPAPSRQEPRAAPSATTPAASTAAKSQSPERESKTADQAKTKSEADGPWQRVIDAIRSEQPAVASFLEYGVVTGHSANTLTLRFDQAFYADAIRDPEKLNAVTKAAKQHFPGLAKIAIEVGNIHGEGEISIAQKKTRERDEERENRKSEALSNPVVRLAVQIFDGNVVDIISTDS